MRSDFHYSPDMLSVLKLNCAYAKDKIRERTELFITLATPHEGSGISDIDAPYGFLNQAKNHGAAFHMRSAFMKRVNDEIMRPESIPQKCNFIVTGGRIQYGSPLLILGADTKDDYKLFIKYGIFVYGGKKIINKIRLNELSADEAVWYALDEVYDEIKEQDLNFFNQAGFNKKYLKSFEWGCLDPYDFSRHFEENHIFMEMLDKKIAHKEYRIEQEHRQQKVWKEKNNQLEVNNCQARIDELEKEISELKKQREDKALQKGASDWITVIDEDGNREKRQQLNYAIDNDSAVRLDSALLYHYWDKLEKTGRFPNPKENAIYQTYVLNHADMKAPVIPEEINRKPKPNSWEEKISEKIIKDNERLVNYIKNSISKIK
mgnify:CR=1 FL=1